MPQTNCKTFIHRFDSDRRLQSTQQLRDTPQFREKVTVVKNVVSLRTIPLNRKKTKRFVKRDEEGKFKESVDVGRSLAADRRSKSKTVAKPGYGDQGDQAKRTTKKAAKKTTKKAGKKAAKK